MRICGRCLLTLAVALGLAGSARADLYPSGKLDPDAGGGGSLPPSFYVEQSADAFPDGSWTVPLVAFSWSPIDLLGVRITSGKPFTDPAFKYFSMGGWSETLNDGTLAAASGPGTNAMLFFLGFSGDISDPVEFDIVAFSGDTRLGSVHGSWDGVSCWIDFSWGDWSPTRSSLVAAVPAPGATELAVLGLVLVGVIRRRFA